jgi:hypothetical protein
MADPTVTATSDPKSILESKTFWGLVIGLLVPFAAKHGYIVDPTGTATDLSTAVGAALALYGRVSASAPVKLL